VLGERGALGRTIREGFAVTLNHRECIEIKPSRWVAGVMTDVREHEAEFVRALARLGPHTQFADLLAESTIGRGIRLDRRSVSPSLEPRLRGAVLRAWGGGRWVEAATSALDAASIGRAADAVEQALVKAGAGPELPGVSATTRQEWTELPARPMRDMTTEEMISLGQDAKAWATAVPGIRDCQVGIVWSDEERFYLNTAGARCYQLLCRVRAGVTPIAIENGRVEFDAISEGSLGGRERLRFLTQENVTEVARSASKLLHAGGPPTGEMTVLLDPSNTGTFAHESFGHGTEADQFTRDRSYLKPILGSMVGPETVTIVDNGAYSEGWGTVHFDDEGHPGQRTPLVDHGRFVGALHDRETAAASHVAATGNSRRSDFLSRLFVRMTNTYVEPGNWTFDELVREAKQGILLERATSGIEDPLVGQMQLKTKKGRKIEHGELTDVVTSMALSGKVLDFLKSIRGVSHQSDFRIDPGYCGKGQTDLLPVGSGGTYLLAKAVVGPA